MAVPLTFIVYKKIDNNKLMLKLPAKKIEKAVGIVFVYQKT